MTPEGRFHGPRAETKSGRRPLWMTIGVALLATLFAFWFVRAGGPCHDTGEGTTSPESNTTPKA